MALAWTAADGLAQLQQYTAPGSLALPQVASQDRLEQAVEEARFRLGPIAWAPWFAFKDLTYISGTGTSASGDDADLTGTVAGGIHAYVQPRRRIIFAAHAIPEYVWWNNRESRNVVNGSYGAGIFAFLSRFTLEAVAVKSRHQEFLSSEYEDLVNTRRDDGRVNLEIPLFGRTSLYGTAESTAWRYREEDLAGEEGLALLSLDRDEKRAGGGLRWHLREGFTLGLGIERLDVTFLHPERDRSNSGDVRVVQADWEGANLALSVHLSSMSLEPEAGSQFVAFDDNLGSVQLQLHPKGRTRLMAYTGRNLVFSYLGEAPYFVDARTGVSVERNLGYRSGARIFAERGRSEYPTSVGADEGRDQEFTTLGAGVALQIRRSLSVHLEASRSKYTSTEGGTDRDVTRFQVALRTSSEQAQWW